MPLRLNEGELISIPPTGARNYFIDTDGLLKELKSDGTKALIGGGGQQATALSWLSSIADFVATKDATLNKIRFWTQCNNMTDLEIGTGTATTGAANVVRTPGSTNLKLRFSSGTTANAFQQLRNRTLAVSGGASQFDNLIANCRTTPFAMACQCIVNAVNATAVMPILNISDEATADSYLGVVGATNQTTFSMKLGAAGAADTGVAIGTLGTTVHTLIVHSDGTNYRAYIDLNTTAVATVLSSNAANAAGHMTAYANNGATTTNVEFELLNWALLKA